MSNSTDDFLEYLKNHPNHARDWTRNAVKYGKHKLVYKFIGGRYMKVLEWITAEMLIKYYTIEDTGNGYYKAYPKETVLELPIECPIDDGLVWDLWQQSDFFCFYDPYLKRFLTKVVSETDDVYPGYLIVDPPKESSIMPTEYHGKPVMVVTK